MRFTVALMMTLATLSFAALPTASQAAGPSTSCFANVNPPNSLVDEIDDNNPDLPVYNNCPQVTNTHAAPAHHVARMTHARTSVY